MRNLLLLAAASLATTLVAGCDSAGPCQNYCDYVCSCHSGEAGYSCETCYDEYYGADPQTEDECAVELTDLKAQDAADGTGCDAAGTDTAAG